MGDDGASASSAARPAAEAAAESGYPSLRTVPPRPHLTYPVQQQRQIVEALIADRENARYTSEVIRHRVGLSSLPPPPTPPEPAPPVNLEPTVIAPPARREPTLVEQETLVDFLAALFSRDPSPAPADRPGEPEQPAPPGREEGSDSAPRSNVTAGAGHLPDDTQPGLPPADSAVAARLDAGQPAGQGGVESPLPPARSAVAARMATPGVIDALVDPSVPQAPLPPEQSGLAARLAAAEQIRKASAAVPLPAPRRPAGRAGPGMLGPPPLKPIVPVAAPVPPKPAEKPSDARSAAIDGARAPQAGPRDRFAAEAVTVANAAP